jgi:hypothetical protein
LFIDSTFISRLGGLFMWLETLSDDDLPGNTGEPENSHVVMMLENMENVLVPLGGNITSLNDVDPKDTI